MCSPMEQVCGAVEGDAVPQEFIPRLLALWRQGRFPVDALVTTFPETEINEAMRAMRLGSAVKPVLVFGDVGGSPGRDAADPP